MNAKTCCQLAELLISMLHLPLCLPQVVLPDGKNQERDVVVFLDEAHAAADDREARQRAAVAALQRVQGKGRQACAKEPHWSMNVFPSLSRA